MYSLEWVACGTGVGIGWVAQRLVITLTRRLPRDEFWIKLGRLSRALVSPQDETQLLREYLQLWLALFRFLPRQLLIMTVALIPIVAAFVGLSALANQLEPLSIECDWEVAFLVAVSLTSAIAAGLGKVRRDDSRD